MSASQARHFAGSSLAVVLALAFAGCDEPPPPSPMMLMQAASNADGDGQQAGSAFSGGSWREQMQMYFGERFADEQGALILQPRVAQAEAPTF